MSERKTNERAVEPFVDKHESSASSRDVTNNPRVLALSNAFAPKMEIHARNLLRDLEICCGGDNRCTYQSIRASLAIPGPKSRTGDKKRFDT